jgi:excisionase family DNA binding protein
MSGVNVGRVKPVKRISAKRSRKTPVAPMKLRFPRANGKTDSPARREFLREFNKLALPDRIEVRIGKLVVELPVSELPALSAVIADRVSVVAVSKSGAVAAAKVVAGDSGKDLTTQQAATILNVSRPFVAALADKGLLPVKMVGRNRRFRLADVLGYEKKMRKAQNAALQELADQAQELELGY